MTQIRNDLAPIAAWVSMFVLAAVFASDFKSGYYHNVSPTHFRTMNQAE